MIAKHEDAQAVIRRTLLGARVRFEEFRPNKPNHERIGPMRRYTVSLPMRGGRLGEFEGSYKLPVDEHQLSHEARKLLSDGIRDRFADDFAGPA